MSEIPEISGDCRKIKLHKVQHFAILFIHLCYPHAFAKLFKTDFYPLSVKPLPIIFNTKVNTDYIISSCWGLTFYLFLQKV